MESRCVAPIRLIVTLLAPPTDHVVAIVDRRQQPRNFLRRILQVRIERDDHLAARLAKAREDRRMLSEVAREFDHSHPALFVRRYLAQDSQRFVARSVVNENHFPRTVQCAEHGLQARPQVGEVRGFVEHCNHDRDQAGRRRRYADVVAIR